MDEAPPAWPKRKLSIFALTFVAIAAIIAITVVALGARYKSQLRPNRELEFALPFTGLATPDAVAVDTAGAVYTGVFKGTGRATANYVLRLAAGSDTWTTLPSAGGSSTRSWVEKLDQAARGLRLQSSRRFGGGRPRKRVRHR